MNLFMYVNVIATQTSDISEIQCRSSAFHSIPFTESKVGPYLKIIERSQKCYRTL